MPVNIQCKICEKIFTSIPSRKRKYCSYECMYKGIRNFTHVPCDSCGNLTKKHPCDLREFTKHFCSLICRNNFLQKENHHSWKGGEYIDGHGYKFIHRDGKYIYEHRYLIEKFLNRCLNSDEHVHHINGNKLDNRIENLKLLSSLDHIKLHAFERSLKWSMKHDSCIECKTTKIDHTSFGFCKNCYARHYRKRIKNDDSKRVLGKKRFSKKQKKK